MKFKLKVIIKKKSIKSIFHIFNKIQILYFYHIFVPKNETEKRNTDKMTKYII